MSNRSETDITFAAELKAAHLAQIEALTAPGLNRFVRAERFMQAARFGVRSIIYVREMLMKCRATEVSVAWAVWTKGSAPYSLFGNMPGCNCPVLEVAEGRDIAGIPRHIPHNWEPTVEDLLPFARVQQERRLHGL
jgi:hypothetical protein